MWSTIRWRTTLRGPQRRRRERRLRAYLKYATGERQQWQLATSNDTNTAPRGQTTARAEATNDAPTEPDDECGNGDTTSNFYTTRHNNNNNRRFVRTCCSFPSGDKRHVHKPSGWLVVMAAREGADGGTGSARRRRERRLRSMLRHERMTVAMALAEKLHHSSRRQRMARTGEEDLELHYTAEFRTHPPPRRQAHSTLPWTSMMCLPPWAPGLTGSTRSGRRNGFSGAPWNRRRQLALLADA